MVESGSTGRAWDARRSRSPMTLSYLSGRLLRLIGVEGDCRVAALGTIHGEVGMMQQRSRIDSIRADQGDAQTHLYLDLNVVEVDGASHRRVQAVGDEPCPVTVGARQDEGELVTAEPGHGVRVAQGSAQTA